MEDFIKPVYSSYRKQEMSDSTAKNTSRGLCKIYNSILMHRSHCAGSIQHTARFVFFLSNVHSLTSSTSCRKYTETLSKSKFPVKMLYEFYSSIVLIPCLCMSAIQLFTIILLGLHIIFTEPLLCLFSTFSVAN